MFFKRDILNNYICLYVLQLTLYSLPGKQKKEGTKVQSLQFNYKKQKRGKNSSLKNTS